MINLKIEQIKTARDEGPPVGVSNRNWVELCNMAISSAELRATNTKLLAVLRETLDGLEDFGPTADSYRNRVLKVLRELGEEV